MSQRHLASAAVVALALLLSGCGATRSLQLGGGSGIEGTGFVDARPGAPLTRALAGSGPTVRVVALDGEAVAGRRLKTGDQFPISATFELRRGTARLALGPDREFTVLGPARVQVVLVDDALTLLLEEGQLESAAAGRAATPNVAALVCEGAFRVARKDATTVFDCTRGALRWRGRDGAVALADGRSWEIDEAGQRFARR